ncbi:kinesin-like protein KIN-7M, chloroplastic isoform X1 [Schistocerca americana]|uniref:kinesin-like protein KIN-7M, chloroplastic isoform X1 n=1 Tax=Schistocerca americana TaxID=7009 RepID=UPI001F4FCC1E|nr:kinesin-like protein KIN-7M, chloroplastic isoform X1 [Schistocerca americana]
MANIKVAVKVRPLIDREKKAGENVCWKVTGNNIAQIDPSSGTVLREGYTFDHVFGMDVSNAEIFDKVVKPLVHPTVDGFNTTIFAYGQTSSGKTYTMLGDKKEPGIIPLTVSAMFDAMQRSSGREFLVRASYMEIYNEKINDLLDKKYNLKIREEDGKAVVIGLKEELVTTTEKILLLMRRGQKIRHIGETNMNERSSRSHTIFRLVVESREAKGGQGDCNEDQDDDVIKVSHLNMVDLAGSERSDQTGSKFGSDRFREGCHINLSLFTLSQVISQLSDGKKHISFRDSKLTRILEPALGGNALTAIICNVTPTSVEETNCTLSFASRAKKIKNEPHVNEVLSNGTLLKRYACQLAKLKDELEKAKSQDVVQEMESKLLEKDRLNTLLQERINRLSKQLIGARVSQNVADGSVVGLTRGPTHRRKTWAGAALSILRPSLRLEPIPESAVPSLSEQTRNTSTEGVPFEEFERDLLDADELAATPTYDEEVFSLSFVNLRRGSERNRGGCETLENDMCDRDEQVDQAATASSSSLGQVAARGLALDHAAACGSTAHGSGLDQAAAHGSGLDQAAAHGSGLDQAAAHGSGLDQATQTEQSYTRNSQAVCHYCCTGALPIMQRVNVSCQPSPATNRSLEISSCSEATETPPHIIRANLQELQKEYEELREFTKLERQIYAERAEMASFAVQTETPCSTKNISVRSAAQEDEFQSCPETDSKEQVHSNSKMALISHMETPKYQISPKFDHAEEDRCLGKDTSDTNDCDQNLTPRKIQLSGDSRNTEENNYSLMQLRLKLDELTAKNAAQKKELDSLNSNNEKLRNRMLTEIATLSQADSGDQENSSDNLAIFDKFVNSIIQKEQEVVKIILEESNNNLIAKENWIRQLEKQVVSLEEELDNSQKEKNKLHGKLKAQKDTLTTLEQDKLHLNKKLTKSEADMSFLQDENKDLGLRLRAAEEKIFQLTENEKHLELNLEKEKEQRILLENELQQTKEKCDKLSKDFESTLKMDEKLLLSEANSFKEQIQKLELENSALGESIKVAQEECLKAKAVATQNSECLNSIKKQLILLVSIFPDSNSIKYHSCEQILGFISKKLSQPCHKCSQLDHDLQKLKLELETHQKNLAISMERQKQLESKNVGGPLHLEGKDLHKLNNSVVHKAPSQYVGDNKKVSFHCGLDTEGDTVPVKDTDVSNQKTVLSVGVNNQGGCRCEELEKENKQLIQEAVARRCKIAQLQEEVANQTKVIELNNSELKEAQHKIRVYKMELKQMQRADRTYSQVNQSRTCCDASSQTDDVRMFINYGCGIVTDTLAENLRMTVFDLRKKNEKLKLLCHSQTAKVNMLENKITELKGEKKTYSNARVQTEDKEEVNFSNKEVQVDMFPLNASQRENGQILFWKSRAEQRLQEKNMQVTLCAKLRDQIKELKQKPEPLAIRNLAYTLRDDEILCLGHAKPAGKENVKYPYIDKP